MALPPLTGTRANQVAQIAAYVDAETHNAASAASGLTGAVTYGDQYETYAAAYPNLSAAQAYTAWLLTSVGLTLPAAIAKSVIAGSAAAANLGVKGAADTGAAAGKVGSLPGISSVIDFLKDLSSRNTLQRLAEGTLGLVLILVGVSKLADGTAVGSLVKKVPFI